MFSRFPLEKFVPKCKRCYTCALNAINYHQAEKSTRVHGARPRKCFDLTYTWPTDYLPRRYCSDLPIRKPNWTNRTMDFIKYSKDNLQKLDRRTLQFICKYLRINASLKTSIIIKNIEDYMDMHGLSELSFFPFSTDLKSDVNVDCAATPLSIKLTNEKFGEFGRLYESKYFSVTTVLKETKSKENARRLADWRDRELDELGEEEFNKMVKKSLSSGYFLHESVAKLLQEYHEYEMKAAEEFRKNVSKIRTREDKLETSGDFIREKLCEFDEDTEKSPEYKRFRSILDVFSDIDGVLAIESGVIHEPLGYAGTVDCIAKFRNKICLIDWKTSKRKKTSWRSCYDYPVQLVAYAAAVNADPSYDFAVNNVALVFASEDDSPATVLMLSMEECLPYYYEWQGRLEQYRNYMNERRENDLYIYSG